MKQHELPIINLTLLKKKSLLAILLNSVKTDNHMFRNLYARDDKGNEIDILKNGAVSCAVFDSAILLNLELIKTPHSTIQGLERDMIKSGWYEISEPKPGAILVWERQVFEDSTSHRHIGFYIGNDEAVSNDSSAGFPRKHHYSYNGTRKIEKIYWHSDLDKE